MRVRFPSAPRIVLWLRRRSCGAARSAPRARSRRSAPPGSSRTNCRSCAAARSARIFSHGLRQVSHMKACVVSERVRDGVRAWSALRTIQRPRLEGMAITNVQASLILTGRHDSCTAAAATAALGMPPTRSHEVEEPHRSRSLAAQGTVAKISLGVRGSAHVLV